MKKNNVIKLLIGLVLTLMIVIPAGIVLAEQFTDLGGVYTASGKNPNGSGYSGKVTISKTGENNYTFDWKVGTSYSGTGRLDGSVLTVDWGDKYPIIYVIQDGGKKLAGTWANGTASEVLTK